ncbi:hypothetical protein BJ742DRAFT_832823 [Cladochytrium replicatum]|nr:hypothetical protein BJ742DRAFT_832823 [Cladochytrium replicatum]
MADVLATSAALVLCSLFTIIFVGSLYVAQRKLPSSLTEPSRRDHRSFQMNRHCCSVVFVSSCSHLRYLRSIPGVLGHSLCVVGCDAVDLAVHWIMARWCNPCSCSMLARNRCTICRPDLPPHFLRGCRGS